VFLEKTQSRHTRFILLLYFIRVIVVVVVEYSTFIILIILINLQALGWLHVVFGYLLTTNIEIVTVHALN
jgi:hypothetical protein